MEEIGIHGDKKTSPEYAAHLAQEWTQIISQQKGVNQETVTYLVLHIYLSLIFRPSNPPVIVYSILIIYLLYSCVCTYL